MLPRGLGRKIQLRSVDPRICGLSSRLSAPPPTRTTPKEMQSRRRQLAELDARIRGCELAIDEAVNEARERVQRGRSAVQPTQAFAVAEEDPRPSEDSTTRTTPTAVRPGTEKRAWAKRARGRRYSDDE